MFGTFAHATFASLPSKPRNSAGETQFRRLSGVARSCRRCDSGRPYVRDFTTGRLIAMGSHRIGFAAAPGSVGRPPCPACGPVSSGPKPARRTRRSIYSGVFVYEPSPIHCCPPAPNPAHPPTGTGERPPERGAPAPPRRGRQVPGAHRPRFPARRCPSCAVLPASTRRPVRPSRSDRTRGADSTARRQCLKPAGTLTTGTRAASAATGYWSRASPAGEPERRPVRHLEQ